VNLSNLQALIAEAELLHSKHTHELDMQYYDSAAMTKVSIVRCVPKLARALKAALAVVEAARLVKLDYEPIHDAAGVPVDRVPSGPPTVEAVAALESACCAFEKEIADV
jgi:hypothetical protein